MVHAVVSAGGPRRADGGPAEAAGLVCGGGAAGVAADGGAARGPAAAVDGDADDRGQPLREDEQGAFQHRGRAPAGGIRAPGAQRRPCGAGGLRCRAPGGRGGLPRGRGRLRGQPPPAALRLWRQGAPGSHHRRGAGGHAGGSSLPPQGTRGPRPAALDGGRGGAPLRHGAGLRRLHVAKRLPRQHAGGRRRCGGRGVTPGSRHA